LNEVQCVFFGGANETNYEWLLRKEAGIRFCVKNQINTNRGRRESKGMDAVKDEEG
jgi:hypothetical protein